MYLSTHVACCYPSNHVECRIYKAIDYAMAKSKMVIYFPEEKDWTKRMLETLDCMKQHACDNGRMIGCIRANAKFFGHHEFFLDYDHHVNFTDEFCMPLVAMTIRQAVYNPELCVHGRAFARLLRELREHAELHGIKPAME